MSKHREDGIAKSSRNMTNAVECIITKVRVSKHREEGIAKESRNIKWSITSVFVSCMYVVSFGFSFR